MCSNEFNGATAVYDPLGELSTITGNCVNAITGASGTYSNSMVYDHLGMRAALNENLSGAAVAGITQSDNISFTWDGNDLVYRVYLDSNQTLMDTSDLASTDNGVLYLYGPTGLAMEFDRYGNSLSLLFDPQVSVGRIRVRRLAHPERTQT